MERPTDRLHRDVSRRLARLGKGPAWLARELDVNRITMHHFLRRRSSRGGVRHIIYDLGCRLSAWLDNQNKARK